MTGEELAEIRADIARPAGKDYDVRCENGSCIKDSRVASHTQDLLDEVCRLQVLLTASANAAKTVRDLVGGACAVQGLGRAPSVFAMTESTHETVIRTLDELLDRIED